LKYFFYAEEESAEGRQQRDEAEGFAAHGMVVSARSSFYFILPSIRSFNVGLYGVGLCTKEAVM
jgi:hypothetical protein